MNAKYYTYRNLNCGDSFSVKYRGLVRFLIPQYGIILDGRFQVSDAGRDRCLREKKRNVHAFIASAEEPEYVMYRDQLPCDHRLAEVKYNPYRANTFVNTKTGRAISTAEAIYLIDGRCFVDDK